MAYAVGVDVGGTKIAAGVVDEHGKVLEKVKHPSPQGDPDGVRSVITRAVDDFRSRHEVGWVGIGAPGFVRADGRGVLFVPNLAFPDEPLADVLQAHLGVPVAIENDVNAAAWAEYTFGAGRGVPDQVTVAVGTGIGGGLILGGELYRGGQGLAAEIGHLGFVPDGAPCPCGRNGCWEQYASGSALTRAAREAAAAGRAPALLEAAGGAPKGVKGKHVTAAAQAGDPDARRLLADLGAALACGVATLVAVLDPDLVVVGGGVASAGDLLLDPLRERLAVEVTGRGHRPLPDVRAAALGNDAGLIGAADLVRRAAPSSA